jgi:precorrin-6B C5,15-methyltransferase / cobalt-precorrin-6B C5,C15-methyltransferase
VGDPWLCIVGIGEDGLAGLSKASLQALSRAEVVFGGPRHLRLAEVDTRGQTWEVPFSIAPVLAARGRSTVVLASGDPFWFGVGSRLAAELAPGEWTAFPAPSTFALAAATLGWRLEDVVCLGLHAAPLKTLRRHLTPRQRLICLVRDGGAVTALADWLTKLGFGASSLWVLEALGGASERIRRTQAERYAFLDTQAPVAVAIEAAGGMGLSRAAGLPDDAFAHDGQITKRPMRALTLSALAPRPGDLLWDIGAGSGSISIEWCLAGGRAVCVEARPDRVRNIRVNAKAFGVTRDLTVIESKAPEALDGLAQPQAVFVGGGADIAVLEHVWSRISIGTRLVVNAVTLETESLLQAEYLRRGGELLRIDLSHAAPLGAMRGWIPSRPVVQWSVVR